MLVFGDVETRREAATLKADLLRRFADISAVAPGLARHERLVGSLIAAGELVGGLLDNTFHDCGEDDLDVVARTRMAALTGLAAAVDQSWRSGYAEIGDLRAVQVQLASLPVDGQVTIKPAEGYVFYALYPETYAEAARRSGLPPGTRALGIRSIGTSLAPMVAAALHAPPPVTIRPFGHPFDRELALSARLTEYLLAGAPPAYAIIDEGPGLSGSSFSCVAEWLCGHGVSRDRIHRFPSHPGEPGAMAGPERLARWRSSPSHHVPFDELLPRLTGWVASLAGPLTAPLRDVSGGGWRDFVSSATAISPVAPSWERRKFLAETNDGRLLVKFVGLGDAGERKLQLIRRLHAAGFVPEPLGLAHGFLVTRWLDAPGLPDAPISREVLVNQLAAYLACRAEIPAEAGGSLVTLREMALYNTAEALGEAATSCLAARLGDADHLEPLVRRVETDNRLHSWEWLVLEGRLIKTDALDHAHNHDFVGPQDLAWDVAGAIVEHELKEAETDTLLSTLASRFGRPVVPELLAFLLPCYLAFQLGAWTMSAGAEAPITRRYADRLAGLLKTSPAP